MPRVRSYKRIHFLRLVDFCGAGAEIPDNPDVYKCYVVSDKKFTLWPGERMTVSTWPSLKVSNGYSSVMYLSTREMTMKGLGIGGEIKNNGELRLVLENMTTKRGIRIE